jgi:hypothetical protein
MKRRIISLLVLAVVLTGAPAAMADHCDRCRPIDNECVPAINYGFEICWHPGTEYCVLENPCGDHRAEPEPLAAEFTVASVERLDEPHTTASETIIASLATPAPANR